MINTDYFYVPDYFDLSSLCWEGTGCYANKSQHRRLQFMMESFQQCKNLGNLIIKSTSPHCLIYIKQQTVKETRKYRKRPKVARRYSHHQKLLITNEEIWPLATLHWTKCEFSCACIKCIKHFYDLSQIIIHFFFTSCLSRTIWTLEYFACKEPNGKFWCTAV